MRCVYPQCDGTLSLYGLAGFCQKCGEPIHGCPKCESPNRTFANFCRACGADLAHIPSQASTVLAETVAALSRPPVKALVSEAFWLAPLSWGGYLWLLSATGQIYRYSPFSNQAVPMQALGQGFGRCAFSIHEICSRHQPPETEPWFLTANRKSVKGFALVSRQVREIVSLPDGEEVLSDSLENYVNLECDPTRVYFLTRAGPQISLTSADFLSGEVRHFPLPAQSVVGPFRCGDIVFAYSETQLYSLRQDELRAHVFPAGFRAWTLQGARDLNQMFLKPAFGRRPYILCGYSVYIPGTNAGGNAFLLQYLKGGVGGTAVIPLNEEATYSQDSAGRPIVSLSGRILTYSEASRQEVQSDPQLSPRLPSFVNGPVCAATAETAGGERIRFFADGKVVDVPVSQFPRYQECVGFYGLDLAVVMTYLTDSEHLGIASWHA